MIKKVFDVSGFGIATLDYLCTVKSISNFNNLTFIINMDTTGGGVVPTALVALERLGSKTTFITTLGSDSIGNNIISGLKDEKIDCSGIKKIKEHSSPFSFIQVEKSSGNRAIAFYRGSSQFIKFSKSSEKLIKSSKIIHLDGYNPLEGIKVAKFAKGNGLKVSLDVNVILNGTIELLKYIDYLIIPGTFLFEYSRSVNVEYSLEKIYKDFKPEILVATFGPEGSISLISNNFVKVEAFKVEAKDTTGAGDVYHGAFIFGIINGWDIKDIMIFASAVSAIKCMKIGGREGIPNYKETINFLINKGIDTQNFKMK